MIRKLQTNEGITYKKLTPEEMKAKGILGRLIGPCADFNNATRNGRKYSEQLWENVFNDPIMQEKIKNGVCFGELGHPEDRTEIDMEKIAVCLREQPVKNDKGQLCAVFDILDTPNGRILKTLCDYGSTVGVSSRGQGDLITDANGDEAVDPDTYECECWDIVLVPAVESARMQYVKEDLDTNKVRMKKALTESLSKASEEEKKIMESTLEELNIKLDEDVNPTETEQFVEEIKGLSLEEVKQYYFEDYKFNENTPADADETKICEALKARLAELGETLNEAKEEEAEAEESTEEVEVELPTSDDEELPAEGEAAPEEGAEEVPSEEKAEAEEEPKDVDAVVAELNTDEVEAIDAYEKATAEIEAMEVIEKDAVIEIINHIKEEEQEHIKELEDALAVAKGEKTPDEVKAEEAERAEEEASEEASVEGEAAPEEQVELEVKKVEEPEAEEEIKEECNGASCADKEEEAKEAVEESVKAIDDGDAALIKSLQEALKGKSDLEGSVKSLQEKLAVSDTKVNELTEENNKYKQAVARLATMSKSNKDLNESVTKLEESLKEKDAIISEQKERIARLVKSKKESVSESLSLNESVEAKTTEINTLTESLNKAQDEVKALNEKLSTTKQDSDKEISELKEGLNKAESVKEAYKNLANKAVNKYIEIKANMLGLTNKDIKRKLGESYTLEDVDQVCEDLKSYQLNVSKLPFSIDRQVGVRVNENINKAGKKTTNQFDDDDVDESLIKLANI